MVLTPDGKLSKYFYGIQYSPRDLRLGLVEASARKIGTPVDSILLFCYHYDPHTGKYGLLISRLIQAGGLLTVLAIGVDHADFVPARAVLAAELQVVTRKRRRQRPAR